MYLESMLKKAEREADEAELFYSSASTRTYRTVLDKIEATESTDSAGFGLRVVKDKRIGFSFFTREQEFEKALKNALVTAKFSEERSNFSFPSNKIKSSSIFNKRIDKQDNFFVDSVLLMSSASEKATPIQSEIQYDESYENIVNSNGVSAEYKGNSITAYSSYKYDDNVFYYYDSHREMIDFEKIAETAAKKSIELSKGKKIKGLFDIAFAPIFSSEFLHYFIGPNVKGEKVFLKESAFTGKKEKRIAGESLSIYDDPTIKYGVSSYPFDSEGVKTYKKPLLEKGVLKNFLYDSETASLAGAETTGNGFRSSFTQKPNVSVTNLVVSSDSIVEISDFTGVVIFDVIGMHNSNALTGDFSLGITNASFVEKGEFKHAVSGCSVSGNFFEMLKHVRVFDDSTRVSSYYGPSLVFKSRLL